MSLINLSINICSASGRKDINITCTTDRLIKMCYLQPSVIHSAKTFWCITNTWKQRCSDAFFEVKLIIYHFLLPVSSVFFICLCANIRVFPQVSFNPGQPRLVARSGLLGQEVCVCLCNGHTCLLTRAMCISLCIPTTPPSKAVDYIPYHHTRQEMMSCTKGDVSPEEVPEHTVAVEPWPSSRQSPLNTDEL